MRLALVVLAMLMFAETADAQSGAQPKAFFPRAGWAYVATSPDAPSLRIVGIYHAKAICEFAVNAERRTPTPGVRMSFADCQPVALGRSPDEAWWLFSAMTSNDPPATSWGGATEQAMCEQVRRTYASNRKDLRVGSTCQPAHLQLAGASAPRVAQPAHALVATPQFPVQSWAYIVTSVDRSGMRAINLYAAKAMCEVARAQFPSRPGATLSHCRPVRNAGGIDSSAWWVFQLVAPGSVESWLGAGEQSDCISLRKSMMDPADPQTKEARVTTTCQRVLLQTN